MENDEMIGIGDVARACGVSTKTVARLVAQGAIVAPYRIPGDTPDKPLLRWKRAQFSQWLESTRNAPQEKAGE
ncbi:hypothetical protein PQR34_43830 [Paraburkholderia sediminicola]|uniref:helix-turn-helix transcriptional regulator n=1 Tax=Paraburkholderia TaxID=1822464 RepID=UPI0038BCDC87